MENEAKVVICEVKLSHVSDAYFQLLDKYVPVIKAAFPHLTVAACEVVKWYDAATSFPCDVSLRPDPSGVSPEEFGVHILNR